MKIVYKSRERERERERENINPGNRKKLRGAFTSELEYYCS